MRIAWSQLFLVVVVAPLLLSISTPALAVFEPVSRGYLTTPAELSDILSKANANVSPYAENVARLIGPMAVSVASINLRVTIARLTAVAKRGSIWLAIKVVPKCIAKPWHIGCQITVHLLSRLEIVCSI